MEHPVVAASQSHPAAAAGWVKFLDWLAAALSLGASIGWVNLLVGVLSALWLLTQLYRFWALERPALMAARDRELRPLNMGPLPIETRTRWPRR